MAAHAKVTKGGYDCEFVGTPPKSLECPVCLLTLREPHVTSCCGNHFCRPCIERVQHDRKPCPLCNDENFTIMLQKGVMREINALMIHCPQKKIGCQWEGELGQLQRHQTGDGTGGCGYLEVGCIYQCGWRFLRRSVRKHETVCSKRPMEVRLSSAVEKVDIALADNRSLKEEVAQLKAASVAKDIELRQLSEKLAAEMNTLKGQVARLKTSVGKQLTELDQQHVLLESPQTPVAPQLYLLHDASYHRNMSITWESPYFYSHTHGYKMKMLVYLDGRDRGKGNHVSLFVGLVVGEYDDKLQWPFRGSVTISVFNRNSNEWDSQDTIILPHYNPLCTGKPTSNNPNQIWGYQRYIPHTRLDKYTGSSDVLRIRVECVRVTD